MSDIGKSTKRLVSAGLTAAVNPIAGTKQSVRVLKDDWQDVSGATERKKQKKDADALAAEQRAMQLTQLAELDQEENRRIKKILIGGRYGSRAYRGSPLTRARPGNTAGAGAYRALGNAPPNSAAFAAAGASGGLSNTRRGSYRALING